MMPLNGCAWNHGVALMRHVIKYCERPNRFQVRTYSLIDSRHYVCSKSRPRRFGQFWMKGEQTRLLCARGAEATSPNYLQIMSVPSDSSWEFFRIGLCESGTNPWTTLRLKNCFVVSSFCVHAVEV